MGYLVVITLYILAIILYGIYISRKKVKSADDFVVAGRRLPLIVLVGTLLATWCGGGGITGSASVVYTGGPGVGTLHFLGAPIGIVLLYFIAGKIRKTEKITIPEVFEARYGVVARILSALCIMLAYVGLVATQTKAAANLLSILTGIEIAPGMIIAIIVIILLTVSGGMVSVAYTDAVSALLMVGGFLLAIPFLLNAAGGISTVSAELAAQGKNTLTGGMSPVVIAGYMIPTIALMLGDQNMMQRFASAKDTNEAKKSNIGMFIAEVVVCVLIITVVTIGIVLLPNLEITFNIIFALAKQYVPFVIGALILAACIAFIITTANSYLLSASTNLTYDIWAKFIKKDATDKQKIIFLRGTIIIFGILAVALSVFFSDILTLQLTAYTMYGATITPALLFALFSKKVTKPVGIVSILVGAAITILWTVQGVTTTGIINLGFTTVNLPIGVQPAIGAVPYSVIAIIIVMLLTKNKDNSNSIEKLMNE